MIVIGITGGIGCGKSAAGEQFERLGWGRADADAIVRELLRSDRETVAEVRDAFGSAVFDLDGAIDRRRLADTVFANRSDLEKLERILHPRVRRVWKGRIAAEPGRNWVVEIPLLFEKQLEKEVDFTLCIACDPVVQAQRLASRGLSKQDAERRTARQLPLAQKIERADFVITNNGSLGFLQDQVTRLARVLAR